jgi:hypothetical protein
MKEAAGNSPSPLGMSTSIQDAVKKTQAARAATSGIRYADIVRLRDSDVRL